MFLLRPHIVEHHRHRFHLPRERPDVDATEDAIGIRSGCVGCLVPQATHPIDTSQAYCRSAAASFCPQTSTHTLRYHIYIITVYFQQPPPFSCSWTLEAMFRLATSILLLRRPSPRGWVAAVHS
ncbi:unnamed protein product [Cylicocyclus nassatus]|uniref:Uncharacterized protein n=1 Tax=Cylicocyclus nassatus TaxID=53992 RepID=A0AA36DTH1_CYLNA|nr:unnamed protein product [Cylicocyclus nassatus]